MARLENIIQFPEVTLIFPAMVLAIGVPESAPKGAAGHDLGLQAGSRPAGQRYLFADSG